MYRSVSLALSEEPPTAVNGNIYHANYECWTSGQTSSVLQRRGRKNRNSNTTSSSPPQRRRQPQTRMHVLSDYFHAATAAAAADSVCRLVLSGCVCFAARQIVKHSVRLLLLLLAKWSTQTGRQTHTSPQRNRKADSVQEARKGKEGSKCVRRYLHHRHHCCFRTTLEYKLYHHHHSAEGQRKGGGEGGGGGGQSGPFRFCRRRFQEKKLFGRERSEGEEGKLLLLTNCSNTPDPQQTLPPPL